MKKLTKIILSIILGIMSVILGVVGVVAAILPFYIFRNSENRELINPLIIMIYILIGLVAIASNKIYKKL